MAKFVFEDKEVQKLAEKQFNYVNWQSFAIALKRVTEDLPTCYDVAVFESEGSFIPDFNRELMRRLVIKHGASFKWALESVVRVANAFGAGFGFLTIADILEMYPEMIVAIKQKK